MSASTARSAAGPRGASKVRAAGLSVASNSALIVLKLVAGALTGSVSVLTEAVHSSIDLIASLVALVSVRKSDLPADADHLYGHEKVENLAAAVEGVLILLGAAVIVYESVRRLDEGSSVHRLGFGIAVVAVSAVANLAVSSVLARRARETESAALQGDAAHLRTDAATSVAVLGGLVLMQITGARWLDPALALAVAAAIVVAGVRLVLRSSRVLVDEALPEEEMRAIRETLVALGPAHGVAAFHRLRSRRGGARRYIDLHVQFRAGTTLEGAHATAHVLQDAIGARLPDADVLIHLEPEDRVRPGTELLGRGLKRGRSAP